MSIISLYPSILPQIASKFCPCDVIT